MPPTVDTERTYYQFRVDVQETSGQGAYSIMRWVDWYGNLYYQLRHYTMRFPPSTDFGEAATVIDVWIRTGATPVS